MIHHEHKKDNFWNIILLTLSVITVLLTLYISFFKRDSLWFETMRIGGPENMALVQEFFNSDIYKTQQTQAIKQALSMINQPTNTSTQQMPGSQTIEKSKIESIKKSGYIQGKQNARITILEYSEFLCPFCKRQSDEKVIEKVMQKYPNDVNHMFRNFIVHGEGAKLPSEALECVGELGGTDKYYRYIPFVFALENKSEDMLVGAAKRIGINETKFKNCLASDKHLMTIENSTNEGRTLFGVNGTPGNVIIDNEKGTYILVAGAYPVETFVKVIDEILNSK